MRTSFIVIVISIVALTIGGPTTGQTSLNQKFNYHGFLRWNGMPLTGKVDLQFQLFDSKTGGQPVGNPMTKSNVNVVDGKFGAGLKFTPGSFNGDERFLEISVSYPAGSNMWLRLSPRKRFSAVPYALYALNGAGPPGPMGPPGSPGSFGPQGEEGPAGPQGNSGSQGPQGPQGLTGQTGLTGATGPQGPSGAQGSQGPQGFTGQTGATGSQGPQGPIGLTGAQGPQGPSGAPGIPWSLNGTSAYYNGGNVGIGTSAPDSNLVVIGDTDLYGPSNGPALRILRQGGGNNQGYLRLRSDNGLEVAGEDALYLNGGSGQEVLCVNPATSQWHSIRASGFTVSSSRDYKQDIEKVDQESRKSWLELIANLEPATYFYNWEQPDKDRRHLGFIAEELPLELRDGSGKAVDLYALITATVVGFKEMKEEADRRDAIIERLLRENQSLATRLRAVELRSQQSESSPN